MESPLVAVFLGVIALTALLQAAFVGALAFAARTGRRKLDALEETFDAAVAPQIRNAARLTDKAAELSEKSLAHARRVDTLVADASRDAERHLGRLAQRLEGAVERTALRVDEEVAVRSARIREHRVLRKLSGVAAFAKGVHRALEVWQASAVPEEEEDEDLGPPDGDPPPDPSPA